MCGGRVSEMRLGSVQLEELGLAEKKQNEMTLTWARCMRKIDVSLWLQCPLRFWRGAPCQWLLPHQEACIPFCGCLYCVKFCVCSFYKLFCLISQIRCKYLSPSPSLYRFFVSQAFEILNPKTLILKLEIHTP